MHQVLFKILNLLIALSIHHLISFPQVTTIIELIQNGNETATLKYTYKDFCFEAAKLIQQN